MTPIPEQITITDPKVAAAFAKDRPRAILFALMAAECSPLDLHRTLGFSLSLLHYHLTRLRKLGLVRAGCRTRRAGRAITRYRAAAQSFLVADVAIAVSPGAGLRAELGVALKRARAAEGVGTIYYRDSDGALRMLRHSPSRRNSDAGEWWWRLDLSSREAEAFQSELRDLISRYRSRATKGAREHLCHFAMARS